MPLHTCLASRHVLSPASAPSLDFNGSRDYWSPQVCSPALAPFPKLVFDSPGFGLSRTGPGPDGRPRPWSFDLCAAAFLAAFDQAPELAGLNAVVMGDSMGGGPVGLRIGMAGHARVVGVVACATSAEEESADIVALYERDAAQFAARCLEAGDSGDVEDLVDDFAGNMAAAGYTDLDLLPYSECRAYGHETIYDSLRVSLALDGADGGLVLDGRYAGDAMLTNYKVLNHRPSLLPVLRQRPSPLGRVQVLVVAGTKDNAYPFERGYHARAVDAVGDANAELLVVEGGCHFVTASHADLLHERMIDWLRRKVLAA